MKNKVFIILMTVFFATNLRAEETSKKEKYYFPYIVGSVLTEYNLTYLRAEEYGNANKNDNRGLAFLNLESNLNIYLFNNFSLKNKSIIRPVNKRMDNPEQFYNDYYTREDYMKRRIYFSRYDVIFEELAFEYREDEFVFGIGKFNPSFGTAYSNSKYHGILDTRIAESYELKEKDGLYVELNFPIFILRGSFFHNDTDFLSRSLFGNRGTYINGKNVGDKKNLDNFSVSTEFSVEDLKFNLGIRRLAANNRSDSVAEKGYVFGVEKLIEETEGSFGFLPFTEVSYIENYNGTKNRNLTFITARLPAYYEGFSIIGSYSIMLDRENNFKTYRSYIAQITLGYKFRNGLMVDISRSSERESFKSSQNSRESFKLSSTGFRVSYMIEFK
jgi:hypothetical protein